MKAFFRYVAALCAGSLAGCHQAESTGSIPAVKEFDAARYEGRWYEIARMPHWFEHDVTDAEALYTMRPDGVLNVVNSGMQFGQRKETVGQAEIEYPNIGLLTVSFGWPRRGLYKIIWIDKEYRLALVTGDTKAYVWILAREKRISAAELSAALKRLAQWGFEVKLLQYPNGQVLPEP